MKSDLIRKIKALLAKSNDSSCTEQERELFQSKAVELMARENIRMHELDAVEGSGNSGYTITMFEIKCNLSKEMKCIIAESLAKLFDTDILLRGSNLCVIGIAFDVELFVEYYISIRKQARKATRDFKKGDYYTKVSKHSTRIAANMVRSFNVGFASKVYKRLGEMYKERIAEMENLKSGAALVVTSTKSKHIADFIKNEFSSLKTFTPKNIKHDRASLIEGHNKGTEVDIRRSIK